MTSTMAAAVGLFCSAVAGLIAIIWRQLDKRIDAIESSAREDRAFANKTLDGIFTELRSINSELGAARVHAAENYITKAECQRIHG